MRKQPTCEELENQVRELEKTVKDLSQSQATLHALLENTTDNILISDKQGFPVAFNSAYAEAMKEVLGIEMKPGLKPHELLSDKKAISFWHRLHERVLRGEKFETEVSRPFSNGQIRHFTFVFTPILQDGEVQGFTEISRDITNHKRAEEALQESEKKLKSIFQAVPVGIGVTKNRVIEEVNDRFCEIIGYSRDEVLGQDTIKFYPSDEEYVKLGNKIFGEIDQKGKGILDIALKRKDGTVIDVLESSTALDPEDPSAGVTFTVLDISDRKRAEKALRESERKLQSIFRAAPVGIVVTVDRVFQEVNDHFCEITGYSRAELLGQNTRMVYLNEKEYEQSGNTVFREIEKTGKSILEIRLRRKDGTIIDVLESSSVLDPTYSSAGVTFAVIDITDRKRAEEALKRSEERYRHLVENINDIIYEVDTDGVITYLNSVAETLTGYKNEELVGRNIFDFVHEEDRPSLGERMQIEGKGQLPPNDFRFVTKSGKVMWLRSSSRPVYREEIMAGFRGVAVDITENKIMEEQLRQARKVEALGTLAGGIAHEFNNILGIILGNAELAANDVPDWNTARNSLEEIRTASLRAKKVVRQIMRFARKSPTNLQPVRIETTVQEALCLSRATIPKNIDIRQEILCDNELILGDSTEIEQICINLCSNAVHAMQQETGILKVRLEPVELDDRTAGQYEEVTPGRYIRLTVQDNGAGIDPKIMDLIFDPYFTTKDVDEGLGMGLAVVYGIVKKHGGAIRVQSEVGKGTTVEVLFPLLEEVFAEDRPTVDATPRGSERILFVDDEPSLVRIFTQMLEHFGYQVIAKKSGPEALEVFRESPEKFDLVITDMAMPDMTGERFAQELLLIRPDIPIILCTGYSDTIDEKRAAELGIQAFVMKPVRMAKLSQTVRNVLDRAGSAIKQTQCINKFE